MFTVTTLTIICSVLQIVGLALIIAWKVTPPSFGTIIAITGFAAVVKVFLPIAGNQSAIGIVAACAGLGIMVLGYMKARDAEA